MASSALPFVDDELFDFSENPVKKHWEAQLTDLAKDPTAKSDQPKSKPRQPKSRYQRRAEKRDKVLANEERDRVLQPPDPATLAFLASISPSDEELASLGFCETLHVKAPDGSVVGEMRIQPRLWTYRAMEGPLNKTGYDFYLRGQWEDVTPSGGGEKHSRWAGVTFRDLPVSVTTEAFLARLRAMNLPGRHFVSAAQDGGPSYAHRSFRKELAQKSCRSLCVMFTEERAVDRLLDEWETEEEPWSFVQLTRRDDREPDRLSREEDGVKRLLLYAGLAVEGEGLLCASESIGTLGPGLRHPIGFSHLTHGYAHTVVTSGSPLTGSSFALEYSREGTKLGFRVEPVSDPKETSRGFRKLPNNITKALQPVFVSESESLLLMRFVARNVNVEDGAHIDLNLRCVDQKDRLARLRWTISKEPATNMEVVIRREVLSGDQVTESWLHVLDNAGRIVFWQRLDLPLHMEPKKATAETSNSIEPVANADDMPTSPKMLRKESITATTTMDRSNLDGPFSDSLDGLLSGFLRTLLRQRPADIDAFAVRYFQGKRST